MAGILIAVALLIYALIDLTVTEDARIRKLNRILWIVIIVLIPVIGPIAWVVSGKGPRGMNRVVAPDDDPKFSGGPKISDEEADRRIRELEEQLAALEAEEAAEREARESAEHEEQADSDDDSASNDSETNGNGTSGAAESGDRPGA